MVTIASTLEYVSALRDSSLVPAKMFSPLNTVELILRNLTDDRLERLERVETVIRLVKVLAALPMEANAQAEMAALSVEIMALRLNLR